MAKGTLHEGLTAKAPEAVDAGMKAKGGSVNSGTTRSAPPTRDAPGPRVA